MKSAWRRRGGGLESAGNASIGLLPRSHLILHPRPRRLPAPLAPARAPPPAPPVCHCATPCCRSHEPGDALSPQHAQPHQAQGASRVPRRAGGSGSRARLPAPLARPKPSPIAARHPVQAPVRRKLQLEEAPPPAAWAEEGQQTATSCPLPLASGPLPSAAECAMQRQDSAWSTLTDMGAQEEPSAPSTPEQSSASRTPHSAPTAWEAVEAPLGYALQVWFPIRYIAVGACALPSSLHGGRKHRCHPATVGNGGRRTSHLPRPCTVPCPCAPPTPALLPPAHPCAGLAPGAGSPAAPGQAGR